MEEKEMKRVESRHVHDGRDRRRMEGLLDVDIRVSPRQLKETQAIGLK